MIHLACEDHTAELPGEIWVEHDGSVCWKTSEVVMTNGTKWLMSLEHTESDVLAYLKLRATVEDNGVFTSDYAYILQPRPTIYPDKPSTIAVAGQMAHAKISYAPIPETTAGLGIAYRAVGMKGFNTVSIESPIGRIVQQGPAEVENYDTLQGLVAIYAPSNAVASGEWMKKCDDMTQRIFDMLSLAQGRLIEWSIRQLGQEARVLETEFNGPKRSGPPVWPVFHHLHLGPVLDLAVNHYTADLCEKTGFPIALEWFVHHPRYTELKLTSVVTALEHLLSAKDPVTKKAVINDPKLVPEALFKVLRKEMEQILTDAAQKKPIDKQEPFETLKRKLGHLNSGTLREKIDCYVCHYKVPLTGIRIEDIHSAMGHAMMSFTAESISPLTPMLNSIGTLRYYAKLSCEYFFPCSNSRATISAI